MGLIAIVDDDSSMREVLRRSLTRAGYAVTAARNGAEAIETISREPVDLVLLDLGLPDLSGLDVLRQIREVADLPVIVVSGHAAELIRLRCFEEGADDYVVKPFFPREIVARVAAVLKRTPPEAAELTFGDVEIDVNARAVRVRGQPTELTTRELDLLIHLAQHPKTALTRQDLPYSSPVPPARPVRARLDSPAVRSAAATRDISWSLSGSSDECAPLRAASPASASSERARWRSTQRRAVSDSFGDQGGGAVAEGPGTPRSRMGPRDRRRHPHRLTAHVGRRRPASRRR